METAAQQAENPISNTVQLKLENITSMRVGPTQRTVNVLTLQPTVPLLNRDDVGLIGVVRLPLVSQPDVTRSSGGTFGLGDTTLKLFLGPRARSNVFWGIGPALRFPTATARSLGSFDSGQFSLGPGAIFVATPGRLVVGAIVNNVWSVAGRDGAAKVNSFVLQPLLNYNLPYGWFLASTPFILCDWTRPNNMCLWPVGGGFGKMTLLSPEAAVSVEAQAYYHVVRPDFGPPWAVLLQATFLFPKVNTR